MPPGSGNRWGDGACAGFNVSRRKRSHISQQPRLLLHLWLLAALGVTAWAYHNSMVMEITPPWKSPFRAVPSYVLHPWSLCHSSKRASLLQEEKPLFRGPQTLFGSTLPFGSRGVPQISKHKQIHWSYCHKGNITFLQTTRGQGTV